MKKIFLLAFVFAVSRSWAADPVWISKFDLVKHEARINRRARIDYAGNKIVFESSIVSTRRHAKKQKNIYIYNRTSRLLKKIAGAQPGTLNGEPTISGNGEVVAYQAYKRSLSPALPPPKADIVIYRLKTDQYGLATPGWNGATQDGECSSAVLNFDAQKLAFSCNATNLLSTTTLSLPQIYFVSIASTPIKLMSINDQSQSANRLSGDPKLTKMGDFLFFKSAATNLTPDATLSDLSFHLYRLDRVNNTLALMDSSVRLPERDLYMLGSYDISEDGNVIALEGRIKSGDDPMAQLERSDLFILNNSLNTVQKISTGIFYQIAHDPSLSADGRYVAFSGRGLSVKKETRGLIVYDLKTNAWRKIYSGSTYSPKISGDGRWIVFETADRRTSSRAEALDIYLMRNPMVN